MSSRLILTAAICVTGLLYYREYTERPNIDSNQSKTTRTERHPIEPKESRLAYKKHRQNDFGRGYTYAEENDIETLGACSNRNPDFVRGCIEFVLRKQAFPAN